MNTVDDRDAVETVDTGHNGLCGQYNMDTVNVVDTVDTVDPGDTVEPLNNIIWLLWTP